MYDQVAAIRKKGLKAAALTEDTRPEELSGTMITILLFGINVQKGYFHGHWYHVV